MVEPSQPGIQRCMHCGWKFVSPDASRIRRCSDCKQGENAYSPRVANVSQHAAIRAQLQKDTS